MDKYITWRQWTKENASSAYAQLTRLDANVFAELWNFLSRAREDASQSVEDLNSLTVKVLLVSQTVADFSSRVELHFKSVLKAVSRLSQSRSELLAFLQDIDLLSPSINDVVLKNASLTKANSYFRCLISYSHAAARENAVAETEKSLNLHNATFKALCESHLRGLLMDLESFSLHLSIAMIRWIMWSNKPSEAASKLLTSSLQQALKVCQGITSLKGSFRIFEKTGFTDEYHVMVKVVGQLKEWPETVLRLKPAALRQLPLEVKQHLRELHKEYSNIYERCAKEEESMSLPSNMQYFRAWQCVSIALGVVAILSIEMDDMDLGMAYFEKAEACIRSNNIWTALKQLYQQLHLAVGFVADNSARLPQAIAWMKQSCSIQQEYFEKFPKEKSNELATKLGFLASLESRALSGSKPSRSTSNLTKETSNSTIKASKQENMTFPAEWIPTDLFPVIDLNLKKQLKTGAPQVSDSQIQLYYDIYASIISKDDERSQDYLKLIEFESTLLLCHGKTHAQIRLINAVLNSSKFTVDSEKARLLLLRVIGARKAASRSSSSTEGGAGEGDEIYDANSSASHLFEVIELLSGKDMDESPESSRKLVDLALAHSLQASAILESPSSAALHYLDTSSSTLNSLDQVLDTAIELYSKVLGRMLSVVIGGEDGSSDQGERSISRSLLEQNRSHWSSIDIVFEQLILLRDLLHFGGDHRRFIALSKVLLKFLATLCPFGLEHGDRARSLAYAQIGAAFHELGYDEPLASKYFAKCGAGDESSLVDRLLQIQNTEESSVTAETSEWLSYSLQYLHDLGRIPEFDYVGHLETVSEQLDAEMDETWHPTRFAFLQQTRATVQFTLAHIKATSGHIDEAIIDALVAFRLRAPSAPKKPTTPAPATINKNAVSAPPYWKTSCWTFIKQFMASMDQVGRLYSLQGSVAEARYYYGMALQMALKHENKTAEFHFNVQLAQLDLDSNQNTEISISASEGSDSLTLTNASALIVKGNLALRKLSLDAAYDHFTEAEKILLGLIENRYVQRLELAAGDEESVSTSTKAKAPARGRGAKKTAVVATKSDRYRFSMSPAKLPKVSAGSLPSDYIGLKRIQLRISMKLAMVDYERARQEVDNCIDSLDAALSRLSSTKEQLEGLGECSLVQYDMSIVMLHQAKVMVAQYEAENASNDSLASPWNFGPGKSSTSALSASSGPAKRGASKSKQQSVDRLLLARETLNSAFALSVSAGSIPKITSDICQYFVEVHGLIDPWVTIARQNSAIGITMRHQLLENLYRLGVHKLSSGENEEENSDEDAEDNDVDQLSKAMKSLDVECGEDGKTGNKEASLLASVLSEMHFEDEKMGGEDFKREFVDILGDHEETQHYTIVTVSLGPDGRSLVISRVSHGENESALVARIDLSNTIDEHTENAFASLVDEKDASESDESDEDSSAPEGVSPALMRSATALLNPLLKSSNSSLGSASTGLKQPSLKRSASSVQSSLTSSASSLSSRTSLKASADAPIAKSTGGAVRAKRSSSTSGSSTTASAAPKRSASTSRARRPLTSIEDLDAGELDDMLSNLSVTPPETSESDLSSLSSTPSLSSSQSSSNSTNSIDAKETVFKRFTREFTRIIADSKSNAVTSAMKNEESVSTKEFNYRWWARRYALDDRLNSWLSNFEDCALSPYKTLLLGQLCDSKLQSSIESQLTDLKARVEKTLKLMAGTLPMAYFRCLILGCDSTSLRDVMETLRVLCSWNEANGEKNAKNLKNAAQLILDTVLSFSSALSNAPYKLEQSLAMSGLYRAFASENADEETELDMTVLEASNGSDGAKASSMPPSRISKRIMKRQKRHPVILIFDKHLHSLPWESLPVMRCNPYSRVPSIYALRSTLNSLKRDMERPNVTRDGIDASKLFYILNPSKDLTSSQQVLEPLLKAQSTWSGVTGEEPKLVDYARALEESNLMLYAGHNSGAQYLGGEAGELKKIRARAGGCVVWMMGCSSLKLKDHADFEPSGLGLTYLMSGAPAVVGNLWDVTTRDLDKATVSLLNWLHGDDVAGELTLACSSSAAPSALPSHLSSSTLPDAILKARKECKLQFINAAALVSYGLPLRVKRTLMEPSSATKGKAPATSSRKRVAQVPTSEITASSAAPVASTRRRVK